MEQHPDIVRARRTEDPGYEERRARRTRHLLFAGLGALTGIVVGLIAVLLLSRPRFSGSPADSAVFLFGLPPLLLVGAPWSASCSARHPRPRMWTRRSATPL